jgi:hypothetical protein
MNPTYWFARGYYDGRSIGVLDAGIQDYLDDECWASYTRGYDSGVADYCEHDIVETV